MTNANSEELWIDEISFKPVTGDEWLDFESLFEKEPGPQQGCWCMYWRIRRSKSQAQFGAGNKEAFKKLVCSGRIPGVLAYLGERPIGWCSIAPREHFPVLDRSRTLKRVDDKMVWSIVCFFVPKSHRGRGLSNVLLEGAIRYAVDCGAKIIEAYPLVKEAKHLPIDRHTGMISTFEKAGFKEIIRRSERRATVRLYV
jgi:GNAT superfamily N-acetyltransferase